MVEDRITDGRRIAQLLASEVRGHENPPFDRLSVVDVQDVEGTAFGAFAYGVALEETRRLADVYVHTDRARIEFREAVDVAAETASEAGLRTRPKATDSPQTIVFLEDGVEVKRVLPTVRAVADATERG
jgi:hypothetical protein